MLILYDTADQLFFTISVPNNFNHPCNNVLALALFFLTLLDI
ncbi:MAG: hypothetical protein E3J47_01560 [Candidatus Stahlbacteria bacterium]|nr:MAG: hypothetical protein E3J47_01560 [Candidatus Stahlbacteria bacterium]